MKKQKSPLQLLKGSNNSGSIIKSWRENFGIKQEDMAYACNLSQANLSAIENGKRELGPRVALKISAFMGISPEVILYPKGYESEPEFIEVKKRVAKLKDISL
jgi:transcriptional regulator with XRE-family HTH domain